MLVVAAAAAAAPDDSAATQRPKRVLLVHSFGSSAPPFTTHSTAFETTLTHEMGTHVDLDEVSLDMARYAQPDMEEPFADFLLKRLAKWQPDLVVPIGSPAGRFVAKFRDRLFPGTPILYTGMDRRTLPDNAFQNNATFVGEDFYLKGLVEDILQLAPDTDNIVVILGATPLERYWTEVFRKEFEPFTPRVRFTWLNDVPFEKMPDLVSRLPPRSFVLLGLLLRDASGVTHNEDEALQHLHAVSAVPINGMYQNQLGMGIVGGRLYQGELEGEESARIAVRILRGEPISNFPPKIIGTQGPRYDWRELRRWKISEDRLPRGSIVEFRQAISWERYRNWIIAAAALISLQTATIVGLVVQRRRRRRAQRELRESQQLMELATGAAELGLWSRGVKNDELWLNASMRSLFGFSLGEKVRFEDVFARVHPDDRRRMLAEIRRADDDDLPFEGEMRLLLPDGSERWVMARGRTVADPAETKPARSAAAARRMGVVLDITQRKRSESELQRHRDELIHLARLNAMGELAASIAHELNQPLTAIRLNAQAARRLLVPAAPNNSEFSAILDDIVDDNRRASEIIRRMHTLARKGPSELAPLDWPALVREVVQIVHSDAALHNVSVSFDTAGGSGGPPIPPVRGDKVQLQQVLLNLLLNAFAAMKDCPPDQREVFVRIALDDDAGEAGDARGRGGMIRTSIRDCGSGLSPDLIDQIFKPFYTTKRDGLGMGLSISRSIVESHGGRLWAENNSDKGATFFFTLPTTTASPSALAGEGPGEQ